jgi:hypothetical protein
MGRMTTPAVGPIIPRPPIVPIPRRRSERLLPPRGDYHTLLSFQKAEVIYDITFRFAHKFLAKSDRTIDQMMGCKQCTAAAAFVM